VEAHLTKVEASGITAAVVTMIGFMALMLLTPAHWFELKRIEVLNARQGQPVPIIYDREFYRDFDGEWFVAVWRMDRAEWASYCAASDKWSYRAASPDHRKDLEWLVGGNDRCSNLPPGTYRLDVTVTANPDSIIARSQTITSNAFEVTP
jgi:hypothetical protein